MGRKTLLRFSLIAAAACGALLWAAAPALTDSDSFSPGLYGASLHRTGAGMRHWYSAPGGFQELTGIPYEKLRCEGCPEDQVACVPCHVNSCDRCHAKGQDAEKGYSVEAAKRADTCLACHSRFKTAAKLDKEAGLQDVHAAAGLTCPDCHGPQDVHGDGTAYESMKAPGAIKASCNFCHGGKGAGYDPELRPHKVHEKRLTCAACHVSASVTCYNCHFDVAMKSGQKPGNFLPLKSFLLLVNHGGKVTAGGVQTLVWKDRAFIAYAPQFTHSVTGPGRKCQDCHANEAVKRMVAGQSVPVVTFAGGKLMGWKGVVPAVPDKLSWVFLQKKDGGWVPLQAKEPPQVQWAGYATPLSPEQLKALSRPIKD
jgi:hypothetical protein